MSKTETQSDALLPAPDAWMDSEDLHYMCTSADWTVTGDKRGEDDVALYTGDAVLSLLRRLGAENKALRTDAERYRWLLEDHASPAVRVVCNSLCERLPVMSYSAACTDIDAAMAAQAAAKNGGAA